MCSAVCGGSACLPQAVPFPPGAFSSRFLPFGVAQPLCTWGDGLAGDLLCRWNLFELSCQDLRGVSVQRWLEQRGTEAAASPAERSSGAGAGRRGMRELPINKGKPRDSL
ncbi:hypothetical protein Anapl_06822 [Anas platyrhynchos]|uniref:Uncharacterized protein n=1 Tax=Anas platyrhynchos TaxID=8839 RepID=R0KCG3_ANAPL|nr:hypothetical protein Anapl_06822 [Anas platyrhynchos]